MNHLLKLTSAFILVTSAAHAGGGEPEEIRALDGLLGAWKGRGTMTLGAQRADLAASIRCQAASGNFGVSCRATFRGIPGVPAYEETDLFGYDPGEQLYHWFAVTSGGETHDHTMALGSGPIFNWTWTGHLDGRSARETIAMQFDNDHRRLEFVSTTSIEGRTVATLNVVLVK
jgi:hypothetical protein